MPLHEMSHKTSSNTFYVLFLIIATDFGVESLLNANCTIPLKGATLRERLECSAARGVKWLLNARNEEWGWGSRGEARSIIALHLAGYALFHKTDSYMYISVKEMNLDLLKAISHNPDLSSSSWGHGILGSYVTALVATCQNPHDFYGHNLVTKLYNHMGNFTEYYQSNKFSYSWALIGVCLAEGSANDIYKDRLMTQSSHPTFGVDTAAMIVMALSCKKTDSRYDSYIQNLITYLTTKQQPDGSFGNEYSTGLAVQALLASNQSGLDNVINNGLLSLTRILERTGFVFRDVLAAAQVLPALARTSYIAAKCRDGSKLDGNIVGTNPANNDVTIIVSIDSDLASVGLYSRNWTVTGPSSQTLFQFLLKLESETPSFSIQFRQTTFGPMINTINGIYADESRHMYWSFLAYPNKQLTFGINHIIPRNGDHYVIRLTKW